jgi:radical SAM superfamily enzyme YgiQ (UPF0313 family)
MSLDGKIASQSGKQMRISCEEDIKRMYKLRNSFDAVLVGIGTILSDNPKLTVKEKYVKNPKQPVRIVLDTNCKIPVDALVVNDAAKTLVIIGKDCNKKFLKITDYRYALARHPMIQILSSRGCPNMCSFCLLPQTMMGRMFRPRSPENFVDELEWISKNIPEVKEIFIEDDTFTVDRQRVFKICELIKQRNLKIVWSANVRADLSIDILKSMKSAGCRILIVGYESGNEGILKNIKKGITTKMAKQFTVNAKKFRLKIFGCFMLGLPGETLKTIEETFRYAQELR